MANNTTNKNVNGFRNFLQKGKNVGNKSFSPVSSSQPVKKLNSHSRKLGK